MTPISRDMSMRPSCVPYFIIFISSVIISFISCEKLDVSAEVTTTSRKKRFLLFPKNTVVQLVYCYLMSAIGSEGIFTVGVTLGTNWDVPTDVEKLLYSSKMSTVANRRDRRSLYPKIETLLNQYPMLPSDLSSPKDEYDHMITQCF